jgi:ABC-type cobalamin/Fe3+-siderophores transport system ATPase subunit
MRSVSYAYPEGTELVFHNLSARLPQGVTALVGQNGTGKSTFMLLASGIAVPSAGTVLLRGVDTRELRDAHARQRHVSLIHQNMEFETEEPIGDLIMYVYRTGYHEQHSEEFVRELVDAFELRGVLHKRTQEVSKGELQRTLLAFCLLYGSRVLMMDEPVFAMEDHQKRTAMGFLHEYVRSEGLTWYYSAHELDLSEQYSDQVVLFRPDEDPLIGPTAEVHTREQLERAYEAPYDTLKRREELYRQTLPGMR